MSLLELLAAVEATDLATAIRENDNLFPWIESLHVLAITCVVGTIAFVDLRLLGLFNRDRAVSSISASLLPLTWGAFALAAVTGLLLFSAKAIAYSGAFFFQGKLVLLGLAGLNMAWFQNLGLRNLNVWDRSAAIPIHARLAGGISLSLWISIVGFGRWIGFTLH
jgi:hypothetical protein